MKQLKTVLENMTELYRHIRSAHLNRPDKPVGSVQFTLRHKGETYKLYLELDENDIRFHEGTHPDPTAGVEAEYGDWLDLAAGRLNPVWGSITGKLKFSGSIRFFSDAFSNPVKPMDLNGKGDPITDFEKAPHRYWTKPENVLLVNGSPRGKGGYTYSFITALAEGMSEAGANVHELTLSQKKIRHCSGCFHCWMKGDGVCIHNDDMTEILDLLRENQLIVYAFPVYVDSVPGMVKNMIDRSIPLNYPYMVEGFGKIRHPRRIKFNQSLAYLSVCGFPELEVFDTLDHYFRAYGHNFHTPFIAGIKRPAAVEMFNNPLNHVYLENTLSALKEAGTEMVEKGKISPSVMKRVAYTPSVSKEFRNGANQMWQDNVINRATTF